MLTKSIDNLRKVVYNIIMVLNKVLNTNKGDSGMNHYYFMNRMSSHMRSALETEINILSTTSTLSHYVVLFIEMSTGNHSFTIMSINTFNLIHGEDDMEGTAFNAQEVHDAFEKYNMGVE